MARGLLPPVGGLLAPPALRPPRRWQHGLRELGLPEGLLALAWTLAGALPDLDPARRRGLALVLLAVLAAEAQGSTCLPEAEDGPAAALARALGEDRLPFEVLDAPELVAFVAPDAGPLVRRDGALSSRRLFQAESALAGRLRALAAVPPQPVDLPEAILAAPTDLSPEQRAAVALALGCPLALVTGGPGTGKTSILLAVLRGALQAGWAPSDLALAAPTGKAAHRMAAALRRALAEGPGAPALRPQTLHRLLGYHPGRDRFVHHAGNPLAARLVVVDEASMVDAVLLARLVDALPPTGRLVLIGDANQLPSVDAGTAFGDLVAGLPDRVVRLTHNHRMRADDPDGSAILRAADLVHRGEAEALLAAGAPVAVRVSLAEVTGRGVELLDARGAGLRAFLDHWLATEVDGRPGFLAALQAPVRLGPGGWDPEDLARLAGIFEALEAARILCPLREAPGLRGSVDLNAYLHGRVQAAREPGPNPPAFSLGEPVMMTRNDHARGIFNGDQGVLLWVERTPGRRQLEVVFPTHQGPQAFDPEPLMDHLELAYALTVHKAQGSEFDRVALVLPEVDTPLATREVLYTALTRARKGVTILGPAEAVDRATRRVMQRHARLRGLVAQGPA